MGRLLPPTTIEGVSYRVLFLGGAKGPRFLIRSVSGPLVRLDFFDDDGKLVVFDRA